MSAKLTQLKIGAFKSIRSATVPVGDMTLVVGRNGSGKSNILDALWVLSALSTGLSLRDALDGGRNGSAVRGGSEGCAPAGTSAFEIGCMAITDDGTELNLELIVQTTPSLQIRHERLCCLLYTSPSPRD